MPNYTPRGIGLNALPCYICCDREETSLKRDMAAFVDNRDSGEEVVGLFAQAGCCAKLDYRPSEPSWVQVKVGACPKHEANLERLYELTKVSRTIDVGTIVQSVR